MLKFIFLILGLGSIPILFADCNEANKLCQDQCKTEAGQTSDCMDSCKAGFDKCEYAKGSSVDKCDEFQRQCSSKCFKVKDPEKCEKSCVVGKLKCD